MMDNFWTGFEKRAFSVGSLKAFMSKVGPKVKNFAQSVAANPTVQKGVNVIRNNPVKSTAIAGGVGLGGGYMMGNNR